MEQERKQKTDPELEAGQADGVKIRMELSDGMVMLSGRARTHAERDRAVWAAWEMKGVWAVYSDIRVAEEAGVWMTSGYGKHRRAFSDWAYFQTFK